MAEHSAARVISALGLWYAASIGLIMYNKWMLSCRNAGPAAQHCQLRSTPPLPPVRSPPLLTHPSFGIRPHLTRVTDLGFHFPVALMVVHQLTCTICSHIAVNVLHLATPPKLTGHDIRAKILPLALAFSCSISFMNEGQLRLSVSFLQMLKASIPFWTVVISFLAGTAQPSGRLLVQVVWIGLGVAVSAKGAAEFQWLGVLLTLAGIIFECIRLVLSQKLLQGTDIKFNALTGVHVIAPLSFCCLLLPYAVLDHTRLMAWFAATSATGQSNFWHALPYLLTNGCLAYVLNLVVYNVIIVTSAVTTGIAGKAKDVINVVISGLVFGTVISPMQWTGYAIAISGVAMYTWDKMMKQQRGAQKSRGADLELGKLLAQTQTDR